MDAERWQRLSPLLDALLELDPETRERSLASLRAEDPQLADDLAGLLALEAEGDDFLSEPLIAPLPGARPDAVIGPYKLDRLLGEGGMGQVWLASRADGLYQRRVALKLLRPGLADPNLRLRFTRERQILARLGHPHIARLLDAGISADNQPYLALDYVDGEPITDWCKARALEVPACVRLFMQVCEAVSHAHANLIVHRDLKPSNILVTPLDEVRLLDFGIAKLLDTAEQAPDNTRTGLRTFTLHYAAPEQIRGEPVTTMTDVYSLGVVLYELLSGAKPYRLKRQTDAEWEEAILGVDPLKPSSTLLRGPDDTRTGNPGALRRRAREVAGDLDNIVLKALAKRAEQRYPSVEALALDLQRYLDGKPVHARPQSLAYRLRKYAGRHRWALVSASLVAVTLAAALGIVVWQSRQFVDEGARAQALKDFVVGLFENAGSTPEGVPLDVRQLLDAGVERGDRELARQPEARAELFGVIARLRVGLGDYEEASRLLDRQAMILDALDEVPPSLRLESATDLGHTRRMLGRYAECIDGMRPWRALARREEHQLPAQASEFYSQLGRCQRYAGGYDAARVMFERSLALRRDPLRNEAGVVENLADLARLHAATGDNARAQSELQDALAQLSAKVGDRHPLAVEILRSLCALRREQGDIRGAENECRRALALALELQGPRHRATIDARRQLAALHVDQGRYNEAAAEFASSQAWLLARLGMEHEEVARNYNSLAIVDWERGDIEAALHNLDRAIAISRKPGHAQLLAGQLFNRAMILHAVGRDAEARLQLHESLRLRQGLPGHHAGLVGDTLRLLGETNAALGDAATAEQQLRQARSLTRQDYGASHSHALRSALSLARLQASKGNPAAAGELQRLASLSAKDIERRRIAWLARAYLAELGCHGPQRSEILRELAALHRSLQQAQPEGGAVVREIDGIRDGCLSAAQPAPLSANASTPL
ncbi:serine/threonine-protein kinase [Luteimonas notoginsengisoli]|uniref:Protein kinase n=1 Tax=Luteimonas notoginsengisoli TaxID=1578200 RepID=A0ABV7UVG0_9GAMM